MLYLICGIIIGFLINKLRYIKIQSKIKEIIINNAISEQNDIKTQFFEPISDKEKYENAQSISDLIK